MVAFSVATVSFVSEKVYIGIGWHAISVNVPVGFDMLSHS